MRVMLSYAFPKFTTLRAFNLSYRSLFDNTNKNTYILNEFVNSTV